MKKVFLAIGVIAMLGSCTENNRVKNWGKKYHKLTNGTEVIFNYLKTDFDKFYNTTYKNKVEKLNEVLVD